MAISKAQILEEGAIEGIIQELDLLLKQLEVTKGAFTTMGEGLAQSISKNSGDTAAKITEIKKATDELNKAKEGINETTKAETKILEEKEKLEARLQIIGTEQFKQNEKLKAQIAEETKNVKDLIKIQKEGIGTLEKLSLKNAALNKERKALNLSTKEGQKRLKEINKELDKNNTFIKDNSDNMTKLRMNVGNYSKSILESVSNMGPFSGVIGKLTGSMSGLSKSLGFVSGSAKLTGWTIKSALISTGIGILLPLIGSLVLFLTKSQKGMEYVERAANMLGAAISVITDRIIAFGDAVAGFLFRGESFAELQEKTSKTFEGMGDEISRVVDETDKLTVATQNLSKAQKLLDIRSKSVRNQIALLRLEAEEENITLTEKLRLLEKANALEKGLQASRTKAAKEDLRTFLADNDALDKYNEVLELATSEYDNFADAADAAKKIIEKIGLTSSTEDDLQTLSEKIGELMDAEKESFELQRKMTREIKSIEKEKISLQKQRNADFEKQKVQIENISTLKKFDIEVTNEQTLALGNNQEVLEKQQKAYQEYAKKVAESQEMIKNSIDQTTQAITSSMNERDLRVQRSLDFQAMQTERNIQLQARLAEQGMQNSLAQEQANAAQIELAREKRFRKERARKEVELFYSLFAEYAKNGDANALGKAVSQLALAKGTASLITSSYFDGTEDTGKVKNPLDKNGGRVALIHDNERIFTKKQNQYFRGFSNNEVVEIFKGQKESKPIIVSPNITVPQHETKIEWDGHGQMIETKIKGAKREVVKHINRRPRLG